jgi:hypothetical protein
MVPPLLSNKGSIMKKSELRQMIKEELLKEYEIESLGDILHSGELKNAMYHMSDGAEAIRNVSKMLNVPNISKSHPNGDKDLQKMSTQLDKLSSQI